MSINRPHFAFAFCVLIGNVAAQVTPNTSISSLELIPREGRDDDVGSMFALQAQVPRNHLATVEHSVNGETWSAVDEEVLAVDGTVDFHAWSKSDGGLFRVRSREMPVSAGWIGGHRTLDVQEPLREDLLQQYLRSQHGWEIPIPSRGLPRLVQPTPQPVIADRYQALPMVDHEALVDAVLFETYQAPGGFEGLQSLYERPELYSFANLQKDTSGSAVIGGSLEVPMRWNVVNPMAQHARYVIQKAPFSSPGAYTEPGPGAYVGYVENGFFPAENAGVSFWLDFDQPVFSQIQAPEAFFVRLYEEDIDGNIIGWPSNTFSFVVTPPPPPVPNGKLTFKLKRLKCFKTTSGLGNDEIHWHLLRVRFKSDKVIVDTAGKGALSFGNGDIKYLNKKLWDYDGPAGYPELASTWYILCMREVDSSNAEPEFYQHIEGMSYLATGLQAFGASQQEVIAALRDDLAHFRWWFFHIGSDGIGSAALRLGTQTVDAAVANGLKRKSYALQGSGSSYSAWFDLEFVAY
jgi:hypothetical protein